MAESKNFPVEIHQERWGDLDGWDDGLPTTIPVKSMLEVQFTVYDLIF